MARPSRLAKAERILAIVVAFVAAFIVGRIAGYPLDGLGSYVSAALHLFSPAQWNSLDRIEQYMVWRKRGRKSARSGPEFAIPIPAAAAAQTLGLSLVLLCASCSLSANTSIAGNPALRSVLILREPCRFAQTMPTAYARLAAGRYCAVAQDMGWIYFEGPQMVTKLGFGSPEVLDGGLYLEEDGKEARAYLVDQLGFRHIYDAHCHFSIEAADACRAGPSSP